MRPLKVWGWVGWRAECPPSPNGGHQTREIVAAHSFAEVVRLADTTAYYLRNHGCVTGNVEEVAIATASPGIVFWRPLDHRGGGGWRSGGGA